MLPVFTSIIKANPIDKFISENYKPEDIVAYKLHKIDNQHGEVWNICISSSPFIPVISEILEYIIKKSLKYSGMYFLSLELGTVIDTILEITENEECGNNLQIFTTVTQASDIRIVVKYRNNIMSEQVIEYPRDKSDMYIHGTIEQAISDKLLYYKEYIKNLNLKICLIFLLDTNLKKLANLINLNQDTLISVSADDLSLKINQNSGHFQDLAIIKLLNNSNSYLALNKPLKSITKLTLINNILFKPVIAIILCMVCTLCYLKYQEFYVQSQTAELNNKYFNLTQEYRDVQKKHPEFSNVNELVDLYNLDRIINKEPNTPYNDLKSLLTLQDNRLQINKLSWRIIDPLLINIPDSKLEISFVISYTGPVDTKSNGLKVINQYAEYLKNNFVNYNVTFDIDNDDVYEMAKQIVIPAKFLIEGKVSEKEHAR